MYVHVVFTWYHLFTRNLSDLTLLELFDSVLTYKNPK